MPIPKFLPDIEPVIPAGYKFVAVTVRDASQPVAIMGWPTDPKHDGKPITAENVEERCRQENLDMVSWRQVQYGEIPKDRTYRDAWEDKAGALAHNMDKARNIHRDHIRVARIDKLAKLDVDYQRADETNDAQEKKRIADKKKVLRDLPSNPAIDAAQTITQLKAFWPADLD